MTRVNVIIKVSIYLVVLQACSANAKKQRSAVPKAKLIPSEKFYFNSFVDCNMAEAWIGDTFRIFPGKYGEDPVWGEAHDLKFADGKNADETFTAGKEAFSNPVMPLNAKPGEKGLHGAVWFETIYQDKKDITGKTLFAVYHNENYPATLPFNASSGEGYIDKDWPRGLTDSGSAAAVCRIGIMKSTDGGRSWANLGIFIEDLQPRMILRPHNTSVTFAGGVGDPSAVVSGNYLYLFYGEYGYKGQYKASSYNPQTEWSGQCISVARISLDDLDSPVGKAKRWDGRLFSAPSNGIGEPVLSLQIPMAEGGGPASKAGSKFHWGPSVSWNTYLNCWVMMMAMSEGIKWEGGSIWISYNANKDLGEGNNSQQWSKPQMLLNKPGHIIWYPSLQPTNNAFDIANKNTCLQLGREARLFFKDMHSDSSEYVSEYKIMFEK
ncbi:MAG TPA: hypothetical protein VFW07_07530 [Parafilimonas sp.]|nr:hypothetical protein [Parafilimonas sp.]